MSVPLPDPTVHGIRVTCKDLTVHHPGVPAIFERFNVEVTPGEKIGIYASTTVAKTALARVLAGLEAPTSGLIRYNGVDLRHIDMSAINRCRGFMIDSQLTLFEGTIEDNIVLGRSYIPVQRRALGPAVCRIGRGRGCAATGSENPHPGSGKNPRANAYHAHLAGARRAGPAADNDFRRHSPQPAAVLRETLLRRLCSKDEPWSVIFVSNDPNLTPHVDRRLILE